MWVVLVVPSVPRLAGKTKKLYDSLKPVHYTDGQITEKLVEAIRQGEEFNPTLLFNTFENIAFSRSSKLKLYREHIVKIGADNIHLAGSGPTLFTLLRDRAEAEELHIRLQQQGLESYLVETFVTDRIR